MDNKKEYTKQQLKSLELNKRFVKNISDIELDKIMKDFDEYETN